MYNVVKQIKRSFTVFAALIITVITTRVRAVSFQTCGPEELAKCAERLSILTDEGLKFVKSKKDLDTVCPGLDESIMCIHGYSRLCMNLPQRKHFRKLFHGTQSMVKDICRNGTYQDEFLLHAPCMQKVSDETDVCFKKYSEAMTQIQQVNNRQKVLEEEAAYRNNHRSHHHYPHPHNKSDTESVFRYQKAKREAADEGIKSVCCSFQEYVDCSTHAIRRTCGDETAHFSRGFLDRISLPMIEMHCMDFSANDCRERGFHIRGFHSSTKEGFYYSNSPQVTSHITALSILAILTLLLR